MEKWFDRVEIVQFFQTRRSIQFGNRTWLKAVSSGSRDPKKSGREKRSGNNWTTWIWKSIALQQKMGEREINKASNFNQNVVYHKNFVDFFLNFFYVGPGRIWMPSDKLINGSHNISHFIARDETIAVYIV